MENSMPITVKDGRCVFHELQVECQKDRCDVCEKSSRMRQFEYAVCLGFIVGVLFCLIIAFLCGVK
jgi:hypothetical protein